jgi:beta-lactamase regulating signal transducer with metallopeptidase domain
LRVGFLRKEPPVDSLLEIGLSNAVAATVLALVAVAVGLACRRPALGHALWLLVLLKLLTPPLVRVPIRWPAPDQLAVATAEVGAQAEDPAEGPAALEPGADAGPEKEMDGPQDEEWFAPLEGEEAPASVPAEPPAAAASGPWWPALAGGVWLAGSLGWFVLAGWRAWRFGRELRCARPAPAALGARVEQLARSLGLARAPAVWLLPGRLAPMVWGLIRPRLLLPAGLPGEISAEGLDTLLVHELAHLRRRDQWVRVLELLALGLYWWHPVVWYARRELQEAEEQCCDAWVVGTLPGTGRTYAAALMDTLDFLSSARVVTPPLASGLGQVADLKRRLTMIMRGTTPRALTWPGCLAVLGLGVLLLPLLPAWGQAQDTGQDKKEVIAVFGGRGGAASDLEKAKAELDRAQAELRKKQAELEKARARLEELTRAERLRVRVRRAAEAAGRGRDPVPASTVIRIEIHGVPGKAAEVDDLVKKLEKALEGKGRRVVILRPGTVLGAMGGGMGGFGGFGAAGGGRGGLRVVVPPGVPAPRAGAGAGVAPVPGVRAVPATPRGRALPLEGLEKKLDNLLREVESLRREIQGGRRAPRGGVFGVPRVPEPPGRPATPVRPPAPARPPIPERPATP